ncbi:MAG: c-type cytochrome biogenesis protein CcmI [bacterium]|jgi:cytochrome c-type biogenesis protein CcmH|nr:c-type cytochrome biogenesis protein CcmI [Betaproteobacteria bacterium]
MTLFWSICAALVLLAVAFVAVPLLRATRREDSGPARAALNAEVYRDHLQELDRELADGVLSAEQHAVARAELDRRALAEAAVLDATAAAAAAADAADAASASSPQAAGDASAATSARTSRATPRRGRWLASGSLALVPVLAIATYLAIGNPAALTPPDRQFLEMVETLAERMKTNPGDAEGWVMLARAYQLTGRAPQAVDAFEKASALRPDDANLVASHADALAMVQGSLSGRPFELIVKALKLDPKNPTALALAATAAMENGQFEESVALWRRLAAVVEPGSRDRAAVDEAIEQVRQVALTKGIKLAEGPTPVPAAATGTAAGTAAATPAGGAAATEARISGEVTLAPELLRQAKPDEVVFIFARAIGGPPLPLAVLRATVKDLPIRFTLDDSMSMAPTAKLSMHKQVVVSARVSRSGEALPQPGDLTGTVQPVAVGATGVQVRITDVVR